MIKRSFNYQRRTREDVLERANASSGDFDSYIKSKYKLYKVRDGKNMIRVLPPTWGFDPSDLTTPLPYKEGMKKARHYAYEIWMHYGIGSENQSYLSLAKMKAERCPLAEAYLEADREGNEKLAKALRARRRMLMWIIDRQAEDEGPQLWGAPHTVDKDIATISADEDTSEVLLIDEPTEGYDVRFYKEGKGINTDYPAAKIKLLGPSPLSEDEDKANQWLEFVQDNPVPECLNFYSYEHISKVFNGNVRMDDGPTSRENTQRTRPSIENGKGEGANKTVSKDESNITGYRMDPDDEDYETPTPRRTQPGTQPILDDGTSAVSSIRDRIRNSQARQRRQVEDDD